MTKIYKLNNEEDAYVNDVFELLEMKIKAAPTEKVKLFLRQINDFACNTFDY